MEQQEPRKTWVTPELIVLVRSRPEEAVLVNCKRIGISTGPNNQEGNCNSEKGKTCANPCVLPTFS